MSREGEMDTNDKEGEGNIVGKERGREGKSQREEGREKGRRER